MIRVRASIVVTRRCRLHDASITRAKPTDCVNARHSLGRRRWRGRRGGGSHAHMHPSELSSITNVPILNTRCANLASMRQVQELEGRDECTATDITHGERELEFSQARVKDAALSVVWPRNACVGRNSAVLSDFVSTRGCEVSCLEIQMRDLLASNVTWLAVEE